MYHPKHIHDETGQTQHIFLSPNTIIGKIAHNITPSMRQADVHCGQSTSTHSLYL